MTNNEVCVWCKQPGTLSDSRPLVVKSVDTGQSIEPVRYHQDCAAFWGNCIFCKGVASPERPLVGSANHLNPNLKALRFYYHEDCGENRVRTIQPWMFETRKSFGGRSLAQADPKAVTRSIELIGEGIRIKQRAWMRLPEEKPAGVPTR